MIQAYFNQIKVIVDQYAVTRFVLDANVSFETRPGDQGYLTGSITFVETSAPTLDDVLAEIAVTKEWV